MTITHTFVSSKADRADTTLVRPSNWNADHTVTGYVENALFDAYSIIAADTDNIPAAITMAASRIPARLASGGIVAATPAQILAILTGTAGASFDWNGQELTGIDRHNYNETNLLENGSFEVGNPPDDWTLIGGSATVSRSSTQAKIGTYSALLTRNGADCHIYQGYSGYATYASKTVTLGCWVYATVAARALIGLGDGVSSASSTFHTEVAGWEWLTASLAIGASPAYLRSYLEIVDGNTSTYFDGAILVEGDSCPAFSDKPIGTYDAITLRQAMNVNGQALGDGTDELLTFTEIASAINNINITNADIGDQPIISVVGDDTNISMHITPKGTGHLNIDRVLPNTVAQELEGLMMVVDASVQAATSVFHSLEVSTTGTPLGEVAALATIGKVKPIHQHVATPTQPDQSTPDAYAGRKTGGGATWADGLDGIAIFADDDDAIFVGSATRFDEIEVIMGPGATKDVIATFWYSTSSSTWSPFSPSDGTEGFQNSGNVSWSVSEITATWTNNGDPGSGDTAPGYWIKIVRTRVGTVGSPVPTTIKIGASTEYEWDEAGDITVKAANFSGDITLAENTGIVVDNSLSADGKWVSIAQIVGTAGINLAFGEAVYLAVADTKWEKARGNAEATISPMTGIVVVAGNEDASVTIMLIGHIRADAAFPALTVGAPVFIDPDTAGDVTSTELTTGEFQKAIGWATTANTVFVTGNPDWVKVG